MKKALQSNGRKVKRSQEYKRIWRVWSHMVCRCHNEKSDSFKNYGGRGISVCDEWRNDFSKFLDWSVKNGHDFSLTIDRINNDGNYEPSNCRWADKEVQSNNKSTNHYVVINGVKKTLTQWAKENGLNINMVCKRIMRGMSDELAVTTPYFRKPPKRLQVILNGVVYSSHLLYLWEFLELLTGC